MTRKEEIIVGLDIGTTKIACIIGEVGRDGIDIIGIGSHPSTGLRKGVVINIDATINSIRKAVEEAELMAGVEVNRGYAGIAGGQLYGKSDKRGGAVPHTPIRPEELAAICRAVADAWTTQEDADRMA